MAQQDININVKVDTSQANQSTENYKARLKQLRDEMTALQVETDGLSKASEAQRKRFNELSVEAGKISDAMGDAAKRVKTLADDYRGMTTALEGIGGAVGGITAVQGAMNLLGDDSNVAGDAIKKVTSLMGILQGIQQVQKTLNKDSATMIALRTLKEKLLTKSIQDQTKAQLALNAAKKGAIGIVIALTAAVAALVVKYVSMRKAQEQLDKEITDAGIKAMAEATVKVNALDTAYTKLGDDLEAKKKFFAEHKDIMGDTAKNVNDIATADKLWQDQTANYIESVRKRAMADAARAKATEKYSEAFELEDYAKRMQEGRLTMTEELSNYFLKTMGVADATAVSLIAKYKDLKAEGDDLMKRAANYESEIPGPDNGDDGDDGNDNGTKNDKWAKQAAIIENKYIPAINKLREAEGGEAEANILQRKMQAELIDNEIEKVKASKDAEEIKENKINKLLQQKKELYTVVVASEEDELDYNEILNKSLEKTANILEGDVVDAVDLYGDAVDNVDAKEEKYFKKLEDRAKSREAIWNSAQLAVKQFGEMVNAQMEAELQAVEGNEKEELAVRKKYAKRQFLAQLSQIAVDQAQATIGAWASVADIIFPGNVIAGGMLTAMIAATGLAQTIIAKQEMDNVMRAKRGGILNGPTHEQGGIMIGNGVEAEGGEAIINKQSTAAFAPLLSQINSYNGWGAPLISSTSSSGNVGGGMITDETIQRIVSATVAGVTSIPVVVSEHNITQAQRNVGITYDRSRI